ncbi:MAG TPA: hypothetical protein PK740_05655 [Bacteroidales bacterium]|nr:hypothetical protein [Bacteroidales bacterium]HPT52750.1 hypothetical protein [Bacteroidales bacterium]
MDTYDADFSKHAPIAEVPRGWFGNPFQLNFHKKTKNYLQTIESARGKSFVLAIEWLNDAPLVYKINRTQKGFMPLSA